MATESLTKLIEENPTNHGLKIALLDALLAEGDRARFESFLYRFLSEVPQEDALYKTLQEYLNKRGVVSVEEDSSDSEEENTELEEEGIDGDGFHVSHEKISFADVGGLDHVKKKIRQLIINPLKNEGLYRAYSKKIGGGILLYGPPGCGKTYMAKAISHELNANFIEVSLHEILDMWMGSSEKSLHEIFERARRNTPCVLFFDEIDALSHNRSKMNHLSDNKIITQFLKELDGMQSDNDKILVMGATNLPWNIDSAFRRPGRFDRILFCSPPTLEARELIFQTHLKGKPVDDKINFSKLAKLTKDYSGADIMHVVSEAADECFEEAMEQDKVINISESLLKSVIKTVKPSTKEWFSIAQKYLDYSNKDGQYDEITEYQKKRD